MHAAPPPVRPPWTWARVRTVLAALLIGARPPGPARPRRPRAPRARLSGLTVDASGIAWRTWWGRRGWVPAGEVDRVVVLICEHWVAAPGPSQHRYALVLDREGGVLLRVATLDDARRRASLGPLDVRVEQVATAFSRAKDYRRRWPEAFGWVHAHAVLTGAGLFGVYVLVVSIAEGPLGG